MGCGHCVAICPRGAVELKDEAYLEVQYPLTQAPTPEQLLTLICSRRSIRSFQHRPVPSEVWDKLLEAGRFTPTGGNRQRISYTVVQEGLEQFKTLAWRALEAMSREILSHEEDFPKTARYYARRWESFCQRRRVDPKDDCLFFDAPALLVVEGDSLADAAPVAQDMELMAEALGLGVLTSGFLSEVIRCDPACAKFLGVHRPASCMCKLVGYPAVQFHRVPPRKRASVRWL